MKLKDPLGQVIEIPDKFEDIFKEIKTHLISFLTEEDDEIAIGHWFKAESKATQHRKDEGLPPVNGADLIKEWRVAVPQMYDKLVRVGIVEPEKDPDKITLADFVRNANEN